MKIIGEAQTLRGMRWKNLWRPSNWMPVTLPVILAAVRYSEQTAISLELRGGLEGISHKLPKFKTSDWIVGIICILMLTFSIFQYKFETVLYLL